MVGASDARVTDGSVPKKECPESSPTLDAARQSLTEATLLHNRAKTCDAATIASAGLAPSESFFRSDARVNEAAPKFPLTDRYDPIAPYLGADKKPTARGEELARQGLGLVKEQAGADGSLSLEAHGEIMKKIAENKSLTEADKWYLYKQVCDIERQGRDADGRLLPGTNSYRVLFGLTPPERLEQSLRGDVVRHLIIDPTMDAYHGGLVFGGRNFSAAFMRDKTGIFMHERVLKPIEHMFQGFPIDRGDEHASLRQLRALKAMQKSGFDGYADQWRREFSK